MQIISNLTHLEPRAPLNTLQLGSSARANAMSQATSNSSTSSPGGIGTTFLNLLTQELQNQDPTAPVDSTAMVGQMISLNQLDQLISINQTLSQSHSSGTGSTASGAAATPASTSVYRSTPSSPSLPASAAAQQLPFDPQTLMPVDMNHPGGVLAPNVPGLNAATWNTPQTNMPLTAAGRK